MTIEQYLLYIYFKTKIWQRSYIYIFFFCGNGNWCINFLLLPNNESYYSPSKKNKWWKLSLPLKKKKRKLLPQPIGKRGLLFWRFKNCPFGQNSPPPQQKHRCHNFKPIAIRPNIFSPIKFKLNKSNGQ